MSSSASPAHSATSFLVSVATTLACIGAAVAILSELHPVAIGVYVAVGALIFLGADHIRTHRLGDVPDQ